MEPLCGRTASAVPPGAELDSVGLLPYLHDPGLPSIRRWVYSELGELIGG